MAQDFQDRLEKTEEEYKLRYEEQLRNMETKWKRKLSLARGHHVIEEAER